MEMIIPNIAKFHTEISPNLWPVTSANSMAFPIYDDWHQRYQRFFATLQDLTVSGNFSSGLFGG